MLPSRARKRRLRINGAGASWKKPQEQDSYRQHGMSIGLGSRNLQNGNWRSLSWAYGGINANSNDCHSSCRQRLAITQNLAIEIYPEVGRLKLKAIDSKQIDRRAKRTKLEEKSSGL